MTENSEKRECKRCTRPFTPVKSDQEYGESENPGRSENAPQDELITAYKELWAAVENGTLDRDFFELRARFRRNMGE